MGDTCNIVAPGNSYHPNLNIVEVEPRKLRGCHRMTPDFVLNEVTSQFAKWRSELPQLVNFTT
ncbi:MAG: hypothetical protein CMN21_15035 [Rubinisphaera sp.]|nr:hypothetical protein [Rubinisphaera sp.]